MEMMKSKLQECFDNSPDLDFYKQEWLIELLEELFSMLPSDAEFSLSKQNRWMLLDMIEEAMDTLRSLECDIFEYLKGENPRPGFAANTVFGPTEVSISLLVDGMDGTFDSARSFSTVPRRDFKYDEEEIEYKNKYNFHVKGLQRKDQGLRKVPINK